MAKLNIQKELLEQVYTNPKLTLKEKLKVLGCSDNHMYKKLREFGIPTNKQYYRKPKEEKISIATELPKGEEQAIISVKATTERSAFLPDYAAYNLNLTVRFKPEHKEDFLAALELLTETLK